MLDLNDADPQREGGGLIPEGTVALAIMSLRPGGFGDDGYIARSKSSGNDMLDAEFTVTEGKYERRKVWKYFSLAGDAAPITRSQLRGALESAFNIDPADMTPEARSARSVPSYAAFDGLAVCIKIGIEKGKGGYEDKNIIRAFVTPDQPGYLKPEGGRTAAPRATSAQAVAGKATAAKAAGKPQWAT